jgi:hypothetical protein
VSGGRLRHLAGVRLAVLSKRGAILGVLHVQRLMAAAQQKCSSTFALGRKRANFAGALDFPRPALRGYCSKTYSSLYSGEMLGHRPGILRLLSKGFASLGPRGCATSAPRIVFRPLSLDQRATLPRDVTDGACRGG